MSTAWEILVAGSTIEAGSAWDHLSHQGGGSGDVFLVATAGGDVNADVLSGDLAIMTMGGDVADAQMDVDISVQTMGGSIVDSMGGTLNALPLGGNIPDESLSGGIA